MREEIRQALWSLTETEAACIAMLDAIERARRALRNTLEGGADQRDSTNNSTKASQRTSGPS